MTLVQAISAAGWFTPLADTNHVQLIRQTTGNGAVGLASNVAICGRSKYAARCPERGVLIRRHSFSRRGAGHNANWN